MQIELENFPNLFRFIFFFWQNYLTSELFMDFAYTFYSIFVYTYINFYLISAAIALLSYSCPSKLTSA